MSSTIRRSTSARRIARGVSETAVTAVIFPVAPIGAVVGPAVTTSRRVVRSRTGIASMQETCDEFRFRDACVREPPKELLPARVLPENPPKHRD